MQTTQLIEEVKSASNMVEVANALSKVNAHYLTQYSKIERPLVEQQRSWIDRAVEFFNAEIHEARRSVFQSIPTRFHHTIMYKRLAAKF